MGHVFVFGGHISTVCVCLAPFLHALMILDEPGFSIHPLVYYHPLQCSATQTVLFKFFESFQLPSESWTIRSGVHGSAVQSLVPNYVGKWSSKTLRFPDLGHLGQLWTALLLQATAGDSLLKFLL